jgi:hypothetical protein
LRTPAETAARIIVRGVERNRRRILVGPDAHVVAVSERLLGSAYQRVVGSLANRILPPAPAASTSWPVDATPDATPDARPATAAQPTPDAQPVTTTQPAAARG